MGSTTARHKVHRAILAKFDVGHVKRATPDERFAGPDIAGASRFKVDCQDSTVGPVEDEECLAVGPRKVNAVPKFDGGWRAFSNVQSRWRHVGTIRKVGRPLPGHSSPTIVTALNQVIHTRGPIPARAHVVLRIRIVSEHVPVKVEVDPVRVSQTSDDHLPILAVRIASGHVTAASFFRRGWARVQRHSRARILRFVNRVAKNGIDVPIGSQGQLVSAMPNIAFKLFELSDFIKLVVSVGVPQAKQGLVIVCHRVERVVGI